MIVDVDVNSLKKLGIPGSGFLLYEGKTTYEFYYANQGPIVFRTIVKKDKNALALMSSIKISVILKTPLKDDSQDKLILELQKIQKRLDDLVIVTRIRR